MDSREEIVKYFINGDMLRQFIEQLQKDFYFSDAIQSLDYKVLQPDEVFNLVKEEIKRLQHRDYERLLSTLYKIDVSEQQLKKEFSISDLEDESEVIAQLIMKRELQKIVYRNYYKNKENEN